MPLYEIFAISRPELTKIQFGDLLKRNCNMIFDNQGVIRTIQHMGLEPLPYRMRSQAEIHYYGRYWLIHFYTNPSFIQKLRSSMKASPDIIRHTITKLSDGIKVDDILHPHSISSLQSYIASQK